ncbi:MAG: bifunctional YncE family protein/alkaline phosphatase family protein [Bryobacterales bacterium]|nr:bifunctional YncE family protein/alkaline phosphatase family protein [Bryobacterales bacterium]
MHRRTLIIAAFSFLSLIVLAARESGVFALLKSNARMGRQDSGVFLLPTNQLLAAWGELQPLKGRPVDFTFDSKKRFLAVLNSRSVDLLDGSTGVEFARMPMRSSSYTGVAITPDDREIWAGETTRNGPDALILGALDDNGKLGPRARLPLKGHPVPAGIAFSRDGKTAYVAFSRNNTVALFDVASRKLLREIETGMAPFAVVASSKRVYISNRGGRRPRPGDTVAPTSGSEVLADPKTGSADSGAVTILDPATGKTQEIAAGMAPSSMALSPDESLLAVANGHSDTLSIFDTRTLKRTDVPIPAYPEHTIGSQPINAVFSPDGHTIYVACGGNNAIAVIRRKGGAWKVEGALPTAWFPSAVTVDSQGALRVLSIKGTGNTADGKGTFNTRAFEGSLSRLPSPAPAQLSAGTREVRAANMPRFEPAGGIANLPSLGIEHVIFIIKENRTYDQVLGDMGKGNGDPNLVMYGRDITPNHHALAEKYVLLDNFHAGGAISFDGHQWLMQAFVSDYVERAFAASPRGYAWNMADALTVSPAGFFWQSATRPLDVRVYGEFCLEGRWDAAKQMPVDMNETEDHSWQHYWRLYKEGKWQNAVGCKSGVPAIKNLISPRYPHSSTNIPDQIRAEEWLREFAEREKSGKFPNISVLTLNNDHTNGTRPGSPTPRAMVADNDLALGRIVSAVSKSRFWPKTLILVTEDDAQNGVDHVDGHRTVGLAIGPMVRRAAVDSNHYNHTSMVRTIQEIFRIPPKTRYVASARAMTSIFTATPGLSSYEALTPKVALDEMNPPAAALRGRQLWAARASAAMNWDEPDDIPQETLNQILWWAAKGWNTPYPDLQGK